ncbi:P-loop containing nucleoside triphosphate hydrolase protein [Melampsora americana]|nr:P-loop containing nucleoside triphosphate hydrolase protein [Melampsora americana]
MPILVEKETNQSTEEIPIPFQDVSLDDSKGEEKEETREKLSRLNFLLRASGIYSQIISQNIERERLSRELAIKKQSEKVNERINSTNSKPQEKRQPTRTSSRTLKNEIHKPNESITKSNPTRSRKKNGKIENTEEIDLETAKVTQLIENVQSIENPEDQSDKKVESVPDHVGQPSILSGVTMRPYQLAADEMGLGKTLQTISFLCYLRERGVWGPFLIVCPLSTVANWVNEFERFCPTVPVLLYHGSKDERNNLRSQRMSPPKDDPKAWLGKPINQRIHKRNHLKSNLTNWTSTNTKETFPVVVTSYEIVMNDRQYLSQYAWSYIVVDESHRLKNLECKLVQELKSYTSANRLLLTFEQWFDLSSVTAASDSAAALSSAQAQHIVSNLHAILKPFMLRRMKSEVETSLPKKKEYLLTAPLTAQQKELYEAVINKSLRTLLVSQKSKAAEEAENLNSNKRERSNSNSSKAKESDSKRIKLNEDSSDEDIPLSKSTIKKPTQRKSLGRETKAKKKLHGYTEVSDRQFFEDVEKGVSNEIDHHSSNPSIHPTQFKKNTELEAIKSVNQMKLQNVMMQLRKVCNHPWLFDWPIDASTGTYSVGPGLISSSGKMLLLDKLLHGLLERGHKVLIFSQFTSMLDIIHDWANDLKGWRVCRIDGSTSQDERRTQMKDFNQNHGPDGCSLFLLSTRAGGVGINLVAADTVILFDSDWNPQQDLQAQDRVHRIGQTKPVLVFRLVSGNTIESKMLQKASQKRKLETLVIGNGFDLTRKEEEEEGSDGSNESDGSEDDLQEIVCGKRSVRSRKKSMKDLAEAILKNDGEKIVLAEIGDEILSDEQLESLLNRSDEVMESKLGLKFDKDEKDEKKKGLIGVEVFETKKTKDVF